MTSKLKRNTLKAVAVGALSSALPNSWQKPIINSVVLPAHAQTSATITLDQIANVTITPQTQPDNSATGSIYWEEFHVAFVTGQGVHRDATYALIEGPQAFDKEGYPGVNTRDIRMDHLRNDRQKNEIFIYSTGLDANANGDYRITTRVKNPNGETATTSFILTIAL